MDPHRVNIINTLQLISSVEAQRAYQQQVPWVNVAHEVVNQWFCDFYHPGSQEFEGEFSCEELASLAEFSRFYDQRADLLPGSLPQLLECAAWQEIVAYADAVLRTNGWKSIVAAYGS